MKVKYRLVTVDIKTCTLTVQFYTDLVTDVPPVTIQLERPPFPTGALLDWIITNNAPYSLLWVSERAIAQDPTVSLTYLNEIMGQEFVDLFNPVDANGNLLSDADIATAKAAELAAIQSQT